MVHALLLLWWLVLPAFAIDPAAVDGTTWCAAGPAGLGGVADLVAIGDHVAVLAVDGSVWTSDDGGARWRRRLGPLRARQGGGYTERALRDVDARLAELLDGVDSVDPSGLDPDAWEALDDPDLAVDAATAAALEQVRAEALSGAFAAVTRDGRIDGPPGRLGLAAGDDLVVARGDGVWRTVGDALERCSVAPAASVAPVAGGGWVVGGPDGVLRLGDACSLIPVSTALPGVQELRRVGAEVWADMGEGWWWSLDGVEWSAAVGGPGAAPGSPLSVAVDPERLVRTSAGWLAGSERGLRATCALVGGVDDGALPPIDVLQAAALGALPDAPLRTWTSRGRGLAPQIRLQVRWDDRLRTTLALEGRPVGGLQLGAALVWGAPSVDPTRDVVAVEDPDGTVRTYGDRGLDASLLGARLAHRVQEARGHALDRVEALLAARRAASEADVEASLREAVRSVLHRAELDAALDALTGGAVTRWRQEAPGGAP